MFNVRSEMLINFRLDSRTLRAVNISRLLHCTMVQ